MPLYKIITVSDTAKVLIWKIEESLSILSNGIFLTSKSQLRLKQMTSEVHKKGFLSVRYLLKEANYTDAYLIYDSFGKPHLTDGKHISVTHSFTFSAIFISETTSVGIDIEKQRDKIVKIAPKFTSINEYGTLVNHKALVSKLTVIWGAKEALYKLYGKKKLHFLTHINIDDFKFEQGKTLGKIQYRGNTDIYRIHFLEFEGFICVYTQNT